MTDFQTSWLYNSELSHVRARVYAKFRLWFRNGKMHNNYQFGYGSEHLDWLGSDCFNNLDTLGKLLSPYGLTIYKALVAVREGENGSNKE